MRASLTGGGLPASTLERWFYALKPASWPKLFVPALFGQILGASPAEGLDLPALGWGLGFTVLGIGFIVLLNVHMRVTSSSISTWGDRNGWRVE